jgi:hypothetical protein
LTYALPLLAVLGTVLPWSSCRSNDRLWDIGPLDFAGEADRLIRHDETLRASTRLES